MNKLLSLNADMAQLAEQLICNQQVIGSSPIIGFHGPLAQLARAHGSYPWCHEFESLFRY